MSRPKAIAKIIELLSKLPGIGEKNATRLAHHLFSWKQEELDELAKAIKELKRTVTKCQVCFNLSETPICHICADPERDDSKICVVETPQDVEVIERANVYDGKYHVLWGLLIPSGSKASKEITIDELIERVEKTKPKELILALSLDPEGEATASFIKDSISMKDINISRIGFGLPSAAKIKFADPLTLKHAFSNRKGFS